MPAVLVAVLAVTFPAPPEPASDPAALLEAKLHGVWRGGACLGTWRFAADGTFVLTHYTPGDNRVTGTWAVRWDALPPALVTTVTTSDAPDRIRVGEVTEVRLVELSGDGFAYRRAGDPHVYRHERVTK